MRDEILKRSIADCAVYSEIWTGAFMGKISQHWPIQILFTALRENVSLMQVSLALSNSMEISTCERALSAAQEQAHPPVAFSS